ncbi:hypothetical protein [Sinorhizobium terangae]|uniref:hypothetical protein n=1 Tax=Sinorhizobium terangae TaxID=110322 RepID=UPI0024B1057B|nr:hypothetical protein [Sinorhizobium terangae]WFU49157.1 hypothetical protein QA637_07095 [Sinorhizobium terangae]
MARPGYIDAADDMLIDFDRLDRKNKGKITPSVEDSIMRMAQMELSSEWIAEQLELQQSEVSLVIQSQAYKLR